MLPGSILQLRGEFRAPHRGGLATEGLTRRSNRRPGPVKRSADRQTARRSLSRWAVHLGLLGSAAAALGTLYLLHVRIAIHTVVGLVFVALVVVHLAQRPRALARIATRTVQARTIAERAIRLAASDLLLLFITLNVLVSGVLDWNRGAPIQLPIPGPFGRWHAISGLALIVYLVRYRSSVRASGSGRSHPPGQRVEGPRKLSAARSSGNG